MVAGDRRLRSLRRGRRILKDGVVGAVVEAGARTGDVAPADTAYVVLIGAVAVGNAGAGMVVEGMAFGLAASFFALGLRPRLETVFSSVVYVPERSVLASKCGESSLPCHSQVLSVAPVASQCLLVPV